MDAVTSNGPVDHKRTVGAIIICALLVLIMTPVGHLLGVPRVEDSWPPYPISYFLFTICFEVVAGGIAGWFALALTFKIIRVDHPMLVLYVVATIYIVLIVGMLLALLAMGHSLADPLGDLAQLVGTVMGLGVGKTFNSEGPAPVATTNHSAGLGSSKTSDRPKVNPAPSGAYHEAMIKDAETWQAGFYKFLRDNHENLLLGTTNRDLVILAAMTNWMFLFGDYGPKVSEDESLKSAVQDAFKNLRQVPTDEDRTVELTVAMIISAAAQDTPVEMFKSHFDKLLELGLVMSGINISGIELRLAAAHRPYYYYMQYRDL